VYLKPSLPQLDAMIAAFAASPHRVAAYIPGLDKERTQRLRAPHRIVSERPMRLAPLLAECDLYVSTGGNVCVGTLMSGVPQLVMPGQYEQYITARRIEQLGVGAWLRPDATTANVAVTLKRLLDDPRYPAAARAYAKRYAAYSPAEQQRRIVARIEEILARPSRWGAPGAGSILTPTSNPQGHPT
jgi:UDP:flavonoid glycosyltransferase YjiC (YdhE family)